MNVDPLDHYCAEIVDLYEGGSTIDDPVAGLTSDMKGRWTIGAFDTEKSNKKETPKMKEAIYSNNAGVMEVFKFFEKATDKEKLQFDELINSGMSNAALELMEKVLAITFQGDLVQR
jgi:hypothetical protein